MNKIIYNEKLDIIYLLIYILGSGTSSKIWYCIEIKDYVKTLKQNKGKFNINCKALKIFKEERGNRRRNKRYGGFCNKTFACLYNLGHKSVSGPRQIKRTCASCAKLAKK